MSKRPKKPLLKRWWFWALAIILFFMLIDDEDEPIETVISEDDIAVTEEVEAESEPESSVDEEPPEEALTAYNVGDTAQLNDHQLTVLKVEKSNGNNYDQPKEGKEFVIVSVQIENVGSNEVSYNSFDFEMSNSQGQIVEPAFTIVDSDTSLESGDLATGGSVTGTVAFEQPKDDQGLKLHYEPGFWSNDQITVNIK
ncbi:DUF4352 domain-containing protein [Halobacillus fulvus]|nr:DUF4352 domain-containing protein [Halobacillus fulvus]